VESLGHLKAIIHGPHRVLVVFYCDSCGRRDRWLLRLKVHYIAIVQSICTHVRFREVGFSLYRAFLRVENIHIRAGRAYVLSSCHGCPVSGYCLDDIRQIILSESLLPSMDVTTRTLDSFFLVLSSESNSALF
jgi:hypothetical protein